MKTRRVLRYSCDFCRKSGCGKAAMVAHELRCFKNPQRVCPLCSQGVGQTPLPQLLAILEDIDISNKIEKVKELKEATQGCPACMLAALNQTPPLEVDYDNWDGSVGFTRKENWAFTSGFDYKSARDEWVEEMRREEVGYCAPVEPPF